MKIEKIAVGKENESTFIKAEEDGESSYGIKTWFGVIEFTKKQVKEIKEILNKDPKLI